MNQLIQKYYSILEDILDENGAVFYSSINTIKEGDFLIMGLNPGGNPQSINMTLRASLEKFQNADYNEYYENWNENKEHRLQKNLKAIFQHINIDLKDVCATNLIFKRSVGESSIDSSILEQCLRVHELTFDIVRPKVILTFGKKPFLILRDYFIKTKQAVTNIVEEESGHDRWKLRRFETFRKNKNMIVIGLPHLSVYTIYNKKEKLNWIRDMISDVVQ